MFAYPELEANIGGGETSVGAVLSYDGVDYAVTGEFSQRWKRKEVDGQLTTDSPLESITFTMPASQVPADVDRKYWVLFQFTIDGEEYTVRYATGTNPVTFYLVKPAEIIPKPEPEPKEPGDGDEGEDEGTEGVGDDTDTTEDDGDDIGGIV